MNKMNLPGSIRKKLAEVKLVHDKFYETAGCELPEWDEKVIIHMALRDLGLHYANLIKDYENMEALLKTLD